MTQVSRRTFLAGMAAGGAAVVGLGSTALYFSRGFEHASVSKHALRGLLIRQGAKFPAGYRPHMGGYVAAGGHGVIGWDELMPVAGTVLPGNPIDSAIAEIRKWNGANPKAQQALKLRVASGVRTAPYALGQTFLASDPASGATGQCPRFWAPTYRTQWRRFAAALAAKYDGVPEIANVVLARAMTIYNEPMIRQGSNKLQVAAMVAAGFDSAIDQVQQVEDAIYLAGLWKSTTVGYALNPYQVINPIGKTDVAATIAMAEAMRTAAPGLGLENDSLRDAYITGTGVYQTMYGAMTEAGAPLGVQTATLARVGDLYATIVGAHAMGFSHVELPAGFETVLTVAQVATLQALF